MALLPKAQRRFCPEVQGRPEQADGPVTLTLLGTLRGVSLARLSFSPVRPVANQLRVTTHIQVVLKFNVADTDLPGFGKPGRSAPADPLLEVLKRSVINPEQVQPSAPALPAAAMAPRQTGSPRAIVSVAQPGLTAISYASLAAIDFPLAGIDPLSLRLTRAGSEIAMQWDGDGDAVFEAGERLLFYADPRFSRWTNTDEYYLSVGAQPGLRMTSRPAHPAPQLAGTAWLTQTSKSTRSIPRPVTAGACRRGATAIAGPGTMCASRIVHPPPMASARSPPWMRPSPRPLRSGSSVTPTSQSSRPITAWMLRSTGFGLGRIEWDGRQAITATLPVAPGVLTAADNVLSLNLPGVGSIVEGMWLDGFALRYARGTDPAGSSVLFTGDAAPRTYSLGLTSTAGLRGYDVTVPEAPISLLDINQAPITVSDPVSGGGHRYLLAAAEAIRPPAAMRLATELQPVSGADYLILAPAPFMPALADLITLRQSQGLRVAVESLQAIYDAFDGRPTPDAIHAYLQAAYTTWQPRPAYLLLVGDGTFDPKLYRADSKATFLPPYLADVDPWMGETAADNRYALLDGGGDILPDLLVGRLPVNTITETQIVVDKIVRYETDPYPWRMEQQRGLRR